MHHGKYIHVPSFLFSEKSPFTSLHFTSLSFHHLSSFIFHLSSFNFPLSTFLWFTRMLHCGDNFTARTTLPSSFRSISTYLTYINISISLCPLIYIHFHYLPICLFFIAKALAAANPRHSSWTNTSTGATTVSSPQPLRHWASRPGSTVSPGPLSSSTTTRSDTLNHSRSTGRLSFGSLRRSSTSTLTASQPLCDSVHRDQFHRRPLRQLLLHR